MATIEMYTKESCPYCVAAKNLLKAKGVTYKEIDLTDDDAGRAELIKKSNGQRTVPQIFINGKHIGGFSELDALDKQGNLDPLLK